MVEIHNVNNQNSPTQWFQSLPVVTQFWFGATVVVTLCGNFGVIDARQFLWSWTDIKDRFELWRVLTCFCYAGPFDFMTLVTVCTCVCYSIWSMRFRSLVTLFISMYPVTCD